MNFVPDTFIRNMQEADIHDGVFLLVSNNTNLLKEEIENFIEAVNPISPSQKALNTFKVYTEEAYIPVDQVRDFIAFEAKMPVGVPVKNLIFQEVDKLSDAGADILLKTLEEPHSHSLIVLSASSTLNVRQTVLSRSIIFKHYDSQPQSVNKYLKVKEILKQYPYNLDNIKAAKDIILDLGPMNFIKAFFQDMSGIEEEQILKTALNLNHTGMSQSMLANYLATSYFNLFHQPIAINSFLHLMR